jgi:hypothetical protein
MQNPDSTWTVRLTRSNHILSVLRDTFFPVDFADVIIHNTDGTTETLELLRTGSGTFKGKTYPQPGETYRITISAKGLEAVESEMTMPSVVPIVKIEFDSTGVPPRDSNRPFYQAYLPFTLTFNDPPGERNFYTVEAIGYKRIKYGPLGQEIVDTVATRSFVSIRDPGIATEDDRRERFTDDTFDGRTYNAPLATSFYSFPDSELIAFEIKLTCMSKEYFRYEETAELSFDVMGDPFAQPVQVYSNVSNGFGIFTGGSYDKRRYDVKQEP